MLTTSQVASQIVLIFLLMAVGFGLRKLHFLSKTTVDDLTRILLNVIGPALIIEAFEVPFSVSRVQLLLLGSAAFVVLYILEIALSHLIFMRTHDANLKRIAIYSSIYSNVGFLGVPLASALFGKTGVFFAVVAMAVFNIFTWSHGVSLFRVDSDESVSRAKRVWQACKRIFLNPNIIAIALGLVLFFTGWRLPSLLDKTFGYIADMNTSLSMMVVGSTLAHISLTPRMFNKQIIISLALRNFIFPILAIFVLAIFGIHGDSFGALLLMAACPVASLGVLFTVQIHEDTNPAATLMGVSTLMCVISIPVVFAVYTFLHSIGFLGV
ncbi:AEC family transporter [Alloscardovia venturai]|uniref:AEC family transporter n=1 Tax=Alloscardovia venturai TaxID=1769421 RepID=A0ABW2Y680_9BIFI